MPFGLTNTPSLFQSMMERVLSGSHLKTCLVYHDDIICFGKTVSGLKDNLEEVFAKIEHAGLKLKAEKCHLFHRKLKYLGHIVSEKGVECDKMISPAKLWKPPDQHRLFGSLNILTIHRQFKKETSAQCSVGPNSLMEEDNKVVEYVIAVLVPGLYSSKKPKERPIIYHITLPIIHCPRRPIQTPNFYILLISQTEVEKVQRRAARYVTHRYAPLDSPTEMLQTLKWESLEQRRLKARVVMGYRVVHGLVGISSELLVPSTSSTRGHDMRYQTIYGRTDYYKKTFFPSLIPLWNRLPSKVITATSLEDFKSKLADFHIKPPE